MFEDRIARGMALLDRKYPGWSMHINLDQLSMTSPSYRVTREYPCGCILAQVGVLVPHGGWTDPHTQEQVGSYFSMQNVLFTGCGDDIVAQSQAHGFTIDLESEKRIAAGVSIWGPLRNEWSRAIAARRI